jgi:hypothetical protein
MKKSIYLLSVSALAINTFLSGPASAQSPGINSPFNIIWSIPLDSIKRTYGIAFTGLVAAAAATDIMQICGSATTTVKVTRMRVSGRATAAAGMDVQIIKRSAANTGGTINASAPWSGSFVTGFAYDASDAAGTALTATWTANPTVGTAVGTIDSAQVALSVAATTVGGAVTNFDFGNRPAKAVTLRGAAQCLSMNLNAATYAGNLLDVSTEWTEE